MPTPAVPVPYNIPTVQSQPTDTDMETDKSWNTLPRIPCTPPTTLPHTSNWMQLHSINSHT